jgi:hypothetical protein
MYDLIYVYEQVCFSGKSAIEEAKYSRRHMLMGPQKKPASSFA